MRRFHILLVVGAVSLLALAGCNRAEQSAQTPANSAPQEQTNQAGFEGLRSVVTNTRSAVQSGDFTKAQTEFGKFEDNWSQVEDGVKAKSQDTYDAIEASMDEVNQGLRAASPDSEKLLTALQSLEANVNSAAN